MRSQLQTNSDSTDTEYAAAAIDRLIGDVDGSEPLPAALAAKVMADGEAYLASRDSIPTAGPPVSRPGSTSWWKNPLPAWGAAFASVLLAVGLVLSGPSPTGSRSPVELEAELARRSAAVSLAWQGLGDERFAQVQGYVRWDNNTQRGVMRLSGMPANNPAEAQYQLWIVDPARDENPIDGGVFNLVAGDNLVAIDAKLQVLNPKAFAITLEQPGGVVVSAGPLLVIASS